MLWEIDILPRDPADPTENAKLAEEAAEVGIGGLTIVAARCYLLETTMTEAAVRDLAERLLVDAVVERPNIGRPGCPELCASPGVAGELVHVLPKPGVTDNVGQSALAAMKDLQLPVTAVRSMRKYWVAGANGLLDRLCQRVLANDSIEQVVRGPLRLERLHPGSSYEFQLVHVPLAGLDDRSLLDLSRAYQLHLSTSEMRAVQQFFARQNREPTDVELETIAQTWSEHCSHKTLAGPIEYDDECGRRKFDNLLKETIFAATVAIREALGADDFCVSVFEDNAGIIRFDEQLHAAFKVETHNHPSAIEPYGGSNTGIGGVIRDTLGTGLGARPVCNTDVFCFAPPDTPADQLPPGVLHPRRVLKGVVAGVRDYGNRMGIPTVNGAIYFDDRYLGNPLVYCGNVGVLPVDKAFKGPRADDLIVAIGGRTGRDGIHGATFSSVELNSDSESLSGGAVQIGDAITEKKVLDVVLAARDRNLYTAITDCGAGGFSSAIGEMGADLGAEVELANAPLKYDGLSYDEIWISEAQERMVLSVPPECWEELRSLCQQEGVEAAVLGAFTATGRLRLAYRGTPVGDLPMQFLHQGRPRTVHTASYRPTPASPLDRFAERDDWTAALHQILGSLNVASKEWVIRQYDHEVQGGSVIKPLVGAECDGPSDAAVIRPRLDSFRGLVISCGMNPRYGDIDTSAMASSAIDEAVRNCVAVGADPARIAILDNFCWGNVNDPATLGSLVRAALACHDTAIALGTPFISGKDSLNNEFTFMDEAGRRHQIRIPATLSDQCHGAGGGRTPVRDHGPETTRKRFVPRGSDAR